MTLGVLYYIKAQCVKCNSAVLIPCYENGLDRDFACEVCASYWDGTDLAPAEFTIQGMKANA